MAVSARNFEQIRVLYELSLPRKFFPKPERVVGHFSGDNFYLPQRFWRKGGKRESFNI